MQLNDLIKQYINQINVMQLATSLKDEPWACNLHFYADDDLNIYWLSTEAREHSVHIAGNPNAAIAIQVQENTPADKDVIGISLAGQAKLLDTVDKSIADGFMAKHQKPAGFLDGVLDGTSNHKFYMLKPSKIILFDTKNFPEEPRQIVTI